MANYLKQFIVTTLIFAIAILGPLSAVAQTQSADSVVVRGTESFDRPINPDLYLIRPGERLVVTPIRAGIPSTELVVGPEGKIVDARMGVIDVNGMTLSDVRRRLVTPLSGQYRSADIDVSVAAPRRVFISITGAVRHSGSYLLSTSQRVSEAIERAGGLTAAASTRRIEFSGGPKALRVDLDRVRYAQDMTVDLPLYAGTTITVPLRSNKSIRVVGEVLYPREIELVDGDNLASAIELAGGVLPTGDVTAAYLPNDSAKSSSRTDLRDGDILCVPFSSGTLSERGIVVSGSVVRPGGYAFHKGQTFEEAVTAAGGVTESGVLTRSAIFRRASRMEPGSDTIPPIPLLNLFDESSKAKRVVLAPLDSIYVPAGVGVVKVTGQVRRPGIFPFTAGQTVESYVGGAGGYSVAVSNIAVSIRNRVTGQVLLASPQSIVADGDEILISLTEGRR